MNIFYLSESSEEAARLMCDKHVIKMVTEYTQILSTVHRVLDGTEYVGNSKTGRKVKRWCLSDDRESILYSATHVHHPSTVWARSGADNYMWLFNHMVETTREYTYRYGKRHKCCDLLDALSKVPDNIARVSFTQPPPAMDKQYIISDDSVENYRNYYRLGKIHLHSWKNRPVPDWIY